MDLMQSAERRDDGVYVDGVKVLDSENNSGGGVPPKSKGSFLCLTCGRQFPTRRGLGQHRHRSHGEPTAKTPTTKRRGRPKLNGAGVRRAAVDERISHVRDEVGVSTVAGEAEALAVIAGAMAKLEPRARRATLRWLVDRFELEGEFIA